MLKIINSNHRFNGSKLSTLKCSDLKTKSNKNRITIGPRNDPANGLLNTKNLKNSCEESKLYKTNMLTLPNLICILVVLYPQTLLRSKRVVGRI